MAEHRNETDRVAAKQPAQLGLLIQLLGPHGSYPPTEAVTDSTTLGNELSSFVERKTAMSELRDRTVEWYHQSCKGWQRFHDRPIASLRRAEIEDHIAARARGAPVAARNELQVLKACLRASESRGHRIDRAILEIPPVRHAPKEAQALDLRRLFELSRVMPEYVRRIVPLAGLVGARQRVWFELTDDLVQLDKKLMRVPSGLNKSRRPQMIGLTEIESDLLSEQLAMNRAGSTLVFPTRRGTKWDRQRFRECVWLPAIRATGLEGFTFHMLRHTSASLMAAAGMDPAVAAVRLGHSDGGALFLKRYRHLYEAEIRRQLSLLETFIRREGARATPTGDEHAAGSVWPIDPEPDWHKCRT